MFYSATKKNLNMSIASLKSKVIAIANSGSNGDSSIARKIEVISSNFKSTPTILARDLKIEGEIFSAGLIEIEGHVKGLLRVNSAILREEGSVEGTIIAESLSIRGKFDGIIKARNISINSKAKVTGTIEYETLSVEDGACIDGQFKRL